MAIAIEQIQFTVLAFAYLEYKQIYILFIIRTESHKIIYPVQDRRARDYIPSAVKDREVCILASFSFGRQILVEHTPLKAFFIHPRRQLSFL